MELIRYEKEEPNPIRIEGRMLVSMSFDTEHILKHEYTIHHHRHVANKKKFYSETVTNIKNDESETIYYFEHDKNIFSSIGAVLESLGITDFKTK